MADPQSEAGSEPALDEQDHAPDPGPMPGAGLAAAAALWLIATALGGCFLIAAIMLVFNLAATDAPTGETAQVAGAAAVFGLLAAVHVVLAVQLRRARDWARRAVVLIEASAIVACLVGAFAAFRLDGSVAAQVSGACLLAILLHVGVIALVSSLAMQTWCSAWPG